VVLAVGMGATLYLRMDKVPEAIETLEKKTAEADKYAANIRNAAHLKEDMEAIEAANKAIDARIIRAVQLLDNGQYFYRLERETGVKLLDSRQTTPAVVAKPKGNFLPVSFSVAADGTLPQLIDFLRKIENGVHYSRVNTAACSVTVSKRNSTLTLSLSLDLLGVP
jgi:hypothetical protein